MTDYISKAQVLETYAELYDLFDDNTKIREVLNAVYEKINDLKEHPDIVRCKDCKHATMTSDGKMCKYCAMDTDDFGDQRDVYRDAEWFCADGERR